MEEWLSQNGLGLVGTLASAIAALAALSAARWTRQQARLIEQSSQRKLPIITCNLTPQPNEPGWFAMVIVIRNHAEAPLMLHAISAPRRLHFLLEQDVIVPKRSVNEARTYRHPFPRDIAKSNLATEIGIPQYDHTAMASPVSRRIYVHVSPPGWSLSRLWSREELPSIAFTLSFKDAIDRRFTTWQKIRLPTTTVREMD